jgi:hypothetical protein
MTEQSNPSDAIATLKNTLKFTDDDLMHNRTGQMSEMQIYQLRVRRRQSILIGLALTFVFTLIASLFLYQATPIRLIIGIGVTLCNAFILGVLGRYWMRLTGDIRAGKVDIISGQLQRVVKPVTRRLTNYMIRIGQVEVIVPKDTFKVFEHETTYRLYRTHYTGTLFSAEKITENN